MSYRRVLITPLRASDLPAPKPTPRPAPRADTPSSGALGDHAERYGTGYYAPDSLSFRVGGAYKLVDRICSKDRHGELYVGYSDRVN